MKFKSILLPLFVAFISLSAFSRPVTGDDHLVMESFKKQFPAAESIVWADAQEGIKQVTFTWAGHRTQAWFNAEGEWLGSARDIFFDQLPLAVTRGVDSRFPKLVIIQVTELSSTDGTKYKVIGENDGAKYRISVSNSGDILLKEKLKK